MVNPKPRVALDSWSAILVVSYVLVFSQMWEFFEGEASSFSSALYWAHRRHMINTFSPLLPGSLW